MLPLSSLLGSLVCIAWLTSPPVAPPSEAPSSAPEPAEPPTPPPEPAEPPAPSFDPTALAAALAELPQAPSLAEVQRAALRTAGIEPMRSRAWQRRSRVAAAAPRVSVQYDHRIDQGWVLDQEAGTADALRNDVGNQSVLRIDATWELDRLVFSSDELRAVRAGLDVADARERLLIEVTRLYFERQRLLLEDRLAPPLDLETALDRAVRIRELEGLLTGLTGLDFGGS